MSTQKALVLFEKQGSYAVRDIEVYKPGPGELLIEIKATGLNPVDWQIQSTGLYRTDFPVVLGIDAAGVVKEVGEGVTDFAVGDRVLYQGYFNNRTATFQQHSIVPAEITAKIPSNLTYEEAATIPLALATAVFGLYSNKATPPAWGGAEFTPAWEEEGRGRYSGQPILVVGGSSAVGQQVLQFAKLSGFSPIITTASLHNASLVKSLGATHVIDRNTPLVSAVKAITSDPIKVVYDAIAEKATQDEAYDVLAPGGIFILVSPFAVEESKADQTKEVVQALGSAHVPNQRALGVSLYRVLTSLLASGDVKPNRVEVVPNGLAGIPEALEKLKAGKVSATKLVAQPWET
ncbi:medium-chain dehydrogenase/reductase like protein [Cytidiella melzeri]|nr:medium-chain dehydrogenase/reductase like protein [Cytidiella melzeri]